MKNTFLVKKLITDPKKTVESNLTRCYNIINDENIFIDTLQEAKRIVRYSVSEETGNVETIE